MKWGRHRGRKLRAGLSEHRHENIVFTNQSSRPTQASSWIRISPVTCDSRVTKQPSCRPGGSSSRAIS